MTSAQAVFVVTGVCATGKSTIVPKLIQLLGNDVVVDVDTFYNLFSQFGRVTHQSTLLRLALAISLNGRSTVFCGLIKPGEFESLPGRNDVGTIHYLNLHCSDTVRDPRLRSRLERQNWDTEKIDDYVVNQHHISQLFRETFPETLDVTTLTVQEVAHEVTSWIGRKRSGEG